MQRTVLMRWEPETKNHSRIQVRSKALPKNAHEGPAIETRRCGVSTDEMFQHWAALARRLGRVPNMQDFRAQVPYRAGLLTHRFKGWENVASGLMRHASRSGAAEQWSDVRRMVEEQAALRDSKLDMGAEPRRFKGRPTYGAPLRAPGLAYEPTNEAGVVFAFGIVAEELGFLVQRLQTAFPDCEALREIEPGVWQLVRIEFEFTSSNFRAHGHPADGCDIIVCWVHDWYACPKNIEVVELRPALRRLGER